MTNQEKRIKTLLFIVTLSALIMLILISLFLIVTGIKPFITSDQSLFAFLFGTKWMPGQEIYGIGYMIIATLLSTLGAVILAVPVAVLTALTIVYILPKKLQQIVLSGVELLAGIPSVIYGLFGLGLILPVINYFSPQPHGESLLAVILVLFMMILPIVISLSTVAITAVDQTYIEAGYGVGASKIQVIFKIILPAAKRGIFAATTLAVGRAVGETMAIILVAGNPISGIPTSIFDPIRPLTANIALEMSYASGTHRDMLFATGLVLFVLIMIINILANYFIKNWQVDK